jgi:hypothetical protein
MELSTMTFVRGAGLTAVWTSQQGGDVAISEHRRSALGRRNTELRLGGGSAIDTGGEKRRGRGNDKHASNCGGRQSERADAEDERCHDGELDPLVTKLCTVFETSSCIVVVWNKLHLEMVFPATLEMKRE